MSDNNLLKAHEAIETAEAALRLAKQILNELGDLPISKNTKKTYAEKAAGMTSKSTSSEEGRVIEGVFDGQQMVDNKGNNYPVPANYASKSKLIPGDVLKLTITEEGKFLYKQIGPVERKTVVGPLVHNDGQYQVLADGKSYNVLLASVTYFRAHVGDEVTLIIPLSDEDAKWGAIEAVLPKFEDGNDLPAKSSKDKIKDELDIDEDLEI